MIEEKGSFRDPAGRIFYHNNKVYRKLSKLGETRLKYIIDKNIIMDSIKNNFLINSKIVKLDEDLAINNEDIIFEHEKIPFISYPYEWTFSQLKSAAIHHLDFHLFLLQRNATLINLDNVPEELEMEIMKTYKEAPCGDRSKLLNYFIQSRLKNLTNEIGEF